MRSFVPLGILILRKSVLSLSSVEVLTYTLYTTVIVKDDMAIRAKLKQGNGRGTCCWIKYIPIEIFFISLIKIKKKSNINHALSGYLDIKYFLTLIVNICLELIEC